MPAISYDGLLRLAYHLFLPPQLPQTEDSQTDSDLIAFTLEALQAASPHLTGHKNATANAIDLVSTLNSLHSSTLDEVQLTKIIAELKSGKTIAVCVKAQNCGIVIHHASPNLIFEEFELSPSNTAVMTARGRLIRTLPAQAVALNATILREQDFLPTLAQTICRMSHESVLSVQEKSKKGREFHPEHRATPRTDIVSGLLFGILRGLGHPFSSKTIRKNMWDEIALSENTKRPWRRSAMWTLVRVALQLVTVRSTDGSRALYKNYIAFIACRLLDAMQCEKSVPIDLLYAMCVKVNRKKQKLLACDALDTFVAAAIQEAVAKSMARIERVWLDINSADCTPNDLSALKSLNFAADVATTLHNLDSRLHEIRSRRPSPKKYDFRRTSSLIRSNPDELPTCTSQPANDPYTVANLREFEDWISSHLEQWAQARLSAETACQDLYYAMESYCKMASTVYIDRPEGLSIMILTLLELWIACDSIATSICPLLLEYQADIPQHLFESLLLPKPEQMYRLASIERYLDGRQAGRLSSELLLDVSNEQSFAVRFFDDSPVHQLDKQSIEDAAQIAREQKKVELALVKEQYEELDTLQSQLDHVYRDEWVLVSIDPAQWSLKSRHVRSCERCRICRARDALFIKVHEWPLPRTDNEAKTVVFELRTPAFFAWWRVCRHFLLTDVFHGSCPQGTATGAAYALEKDDPQLKDRYHHLSSTSERLGLLSKTKPTSRSHFASKEIPTCDEETVCVDLGLSYQYFDFTTKSEIGPLTYSTKLPEAHTHQLSPESSALQRFISRHAEPPHLPTPNTVLSDLYTCPASMSLDEFKISASLRLGMEIQWLYIALELASPAMNFNKPDTMLIVLQAISQAGPATGDHDPRRKCHRVVSDHALASVLISRLHAALDRVKKNWESLQALACFVAVASRVLALNESVKEECLLFLQKARKTTADWMQTLHIEAHKTDNLAHRTELLARSVEAALVCSSTFDVPDDFLPSLMQSDEAAVLIRASMSAHEGNRAKIRRRGNVVHLYLQHQRLLHRCYRLVAANWRALDMALAYVWPAFQPGKSDWTSVSDGLAHWMNTTSTASDGEFRLHIHFDILTGELLINGLPPGQAPIGFRKEPLFTQLFGDATVEVMPGSTCGLRFSAKRQFGGCNVELGWADDRLNVRACTRGEIFEIVPSTVLRGIYPNAFHRDFLLWYSFTSDIVHLRHKSDPWPPGRPSWQLHKIQARWILQQENMRILSLQSASALAIAPILAPLADKHEIRCALLAEGELDVSIPSLRLAFSLSPQSSRLRSRDFAYMSVDQDQTFGTLIGFKNKLMLKSATDSSRSAIILVSELQHKRQGEHVRVVADVNLARSVFLVKVDSTLRRLHGQDDLDCQLYLAHLHALTSFCLPDPHTLLTGTEQALTILKSKAVASFLQLTPAQIQRLHLIANVSPSRAFYPEHLRTMQRVQWRSDLSFFSQHEELATISGGLLSKNSQFFSVFFPTTTQDPVPMPFGSDDLNDRALIRSSAFRVSGFGAEHHDRKIDVQYEDRSGRSLSANIIMLAALMHREQPETQWGVPDADMLWELLTASDAAVAAHTTTIDPLHIRYEAAHLSKKTKDPILSLPALHSWSKSHLFPNFRQFAIITWLSTLAFRKDANMQILQIIALFFRSFELSKIQVPSAISFRPARGRVIQRDAIEKEFAGRLKGFGQSQEAIHLLRKHGRDHRDEDAQQNYFKQQAIAEQSFINALVLGPLVKFPPVPKVTNVDNYFFVDRLMLAVGELFRDWCDNNHLFDWLLAISTSLQQLRRVDLSPVAPVLSVPDTIPSLPGYVYESELFSIPPPTLPASSDFDLGSLEDIPVEDPDQQLRLSSVLDKLKQVASSSLFQMQYIEHLDNSLTALRKINSKGYSQGYDHTLFRKLFNAYKMCALEMWLAISTALLSTSRTQAARDVHQLRLSPLLLLKQLAHDRWPDLPLCWRTVVTQFGLVLTNLQRAERLIRLWHGSNADDFRSELENVGHVNWDPMDFPESLLIEVESSILIRAVQKDIAEQMREPTSGENIVCQLNMGEGKSSVIIPIVAANLADQKTLVRIIVAKPQSKQMSQMLIAKLGGLVNRQVYYLPFNRSLKPSRAGVQFILDSLMECTTTGGVLLVQPEHILSLKLAGIERYLADRPALGDAMVSTFNFIDSHSRDLVDESDENFSTRFELIYTMGSQQDIEMSPQRWYIVQQILEVLAVKAAAVKLQNPMGIEFVPNSRGGFPRVRILHQEAEQKLITALAAHVCNHGIVDLHLERQPVHVRNAAYRYIREPKLTQAEIDAVEQSALGRGSFKPHLLLLRGLLAGGVIAFALGRKRFRVDYGPAGQRTPITRLAVPYRAKDSPAPRAEYAHPDIVLVLTSLCFYYEGLPDGDMFATLNKLMLSDQAATTYKTWVSEVKGLPTHLQHLQGINLNDRQGCIEELFPVLRNSKRMVDFFLSHLIFPKEMKEFPTKLSASGWDLCKKRERLTTGFSGTMDSRCLLPLDIHHVDRPDQAHTNAKVLEALLRPENDVYLLPRNLDPASEATRFLKIIVGMTPRINVLLDVGAQILQFTNLELVRTWMSLADGKIEAAVFVNDNDEICVLDRNGRIDFLRTSPFASRLECCLVFLDEAHTRGIDLRLPAHFRAVVTLGAGLTKDRMVQACMRMRKLGRGQSVVFCVSNEIDNKIRKAVATSNDTALRLSDVVVWCLIESQADIQRSIPLWAAQGKRFYDHNKVWESSRDLDGNFDMDAGLATAFLENETLSLEARYRPYVQQRTPAWLEPTVSLEIARIASHYNTFTDLECDDGVMQEEQERELELAPEVEEEREPEHIAPSQPATHSLHPDVLAFALRGTVKSGSTGYTEAFDALRNTTAAQEMLTEHFSDSRFLASKDFATTVIDQDDHDFMTDAVLASPHWILVRCKENSTTASQMMVISAFEADLLLPKILKSASTAYCTLHIYKARVSLSHESLDNFDFYYVPSSHKQPTIPRDLAVQLNLFACQLYIDSHKDYVEICRFLGLASMRLTPEMEQAGWEVDPDGFIVSDDKGRKGGALRVDREVLGFFKALYTIRRGESVRNTHMGDVLSGRLLGKEDFGE